jgi:hypothetical protein
MKPAACQKPEPRGRSEGAENLFCGVPAYRVVNQTGTHFVNVSLGNSVPWVGVLATYLSDVIFAEGFE